ncbi:MAG TPA: 2-dehydro-3-deoxy-6-phosphogalactonate aldolase [Sphingomicrobium sp.]|nr:2-dehydro-3-deoxy-6-phosphogalactonate aldolase [Sphingomicrobium sp.]
MTAPERFRALMAECPLIAILRGIEPAETEAIGDALAESGILIIEVPLNSLDPLASIARLRARLGDRAMIGAGTVLRADDVVSIRGSGGQLIVSPSTDPEVIAATVSAGMVSCPGYFTPTEAFAALAAGAHALKFFPAEAAAPAVLRAQCAVLPPETRPIVVGGVTPGSMAAWVDAGAGGFGLGSGLYRPGQSAADTLAKARSYVAALAQL